jgi:hypothetical protein
MNAIVRASEHGYVGQIGLKLFVHTVHQNHVASESLAHGFVQSVSRLRLKPLLDLSASLDAFQLSAQSINSTECTRHSRIVVVKIECIHGTVHRLLLLLLLMLRRWSLSTLYLLLLLLLLLSLLQ